MKEQAKDAGKGGPAPDKPEFLDVSDDDDDDYTPADGLPRREGGGDDDDDYDSDAEVRRPPGQKQQPQALSSTS